MGGGRRHESESSACGGTQSHEREQSRVTTSSCSQAARDRGEKRRQCRKCGVSHKCSLGWCFLPPRTDNLVQSSIKLVLPAFSLLPRLFPKCCHKEK